MHRLADDNEDNAPFQIDPLGVQAKQVHRLPEPLADGRTLRLLHLVLRDSAQEFYEVTLAYEDLPRRAAPSSGAC